MNQEFNYDEFNSLFEWINELTETLIKNVCDKNPIIRKHSYKGIGNISLLLKNQFSLPDNDNRTEHEEEFKFQLGIDRTTTILSCLFSGMEDSNEICGREALFSILRLIDLLDSKIILPNLLNILNRLPENFER